MPRTPLVRRALVTAVALGAVPLAAAPATAAQLTVKDAKGDMWQPSQAGMTEEDPQGPMWEPAPGETNGDFTRVTFAHSAKRVTVRASYVDLERPSTRSDFWMFAVRVRDEQNRKYSFGVEASKRTPDGEAQLTTYRGDQELSCNLRHRIDYRNAKITVSLLRTCLDDPRWLQFTGAHFNAARRVFVVDNPHSEKAMPKGWTGKVRAG